MKYYIIAILSLFCLFVLLHSAYLLGKGARGETIVKTIETIDTVYQVKPSEPIVLEKVKTKIVYRTDTVIMTHPFVSTVDTVVKTDTVFAKFEYPINLFTLDIRRRPDSTMIQTITITKETLRERAWWEIPAIALSSVGLGYLVGSLGK